MGAGESAVGIVTKQVRGGYDDTNYGERAKSLSVSRPVVRLVRLRSGLSKEREHLLEIILPGGTIHVSWLGMDVNGQFASMSMPVQMYCRCR